MNEQPSLNKKTSFFSQYFHTLKNYVSNLQHFLLRVVTFPCLIGDKFGRGWFVYGIFIGYFDCVIYNSGCAIRILHD